MSRIGFGFDTHKLETGAALFLGGINIPSEKGSIGHSDADVLIHAICDALLGAANLGDIGTHFPDTDQQYKGIDSKILLKKVAALLNEKGYHIVNIDTTICLERPKLAPHIPQIQQKLSEVLGIPAYDISVKAKTSEKLGFIGREEGISAYAVTLIE
ncbi:MAG TPA: 2-C-methyl-D-erythritol 2,4-cyclodiphosphate synthase [Bacteroidales bacterium]|nr:2-C-methyl-D-erythritol 2,4-cyclodiphosphate synthase [Bacteroidales bacterium]HPB25692.1 2-C-methyl-D-erythritol 2,4-cyclodiphosphate synthase [Bacteroidales bacterium]HQN16259.1 2-C-methyl-D-erythritol 2,4-cyclodiphosphate synthase [Bacteroidales bacterium]HQP15833.1 2-C-methyl-D-erythritol 2,4-cyclodiphosphate synthase [Bacteroidales bacterium]